MTPVSLHVSFPLESVERMNNVPIVDDDVLLAIWELSQEPLPLSLYLESLNAGDIVRVLKVLVVFNIGVLPGYHYYIILAWVSKVIDVSLSQVSDLTGLTGCGKSHRIFWKTNIKVTLNIS